MASNDEVARAFARHGAAASDNMESDGKQLRSYKTTIAEWLDFGSVDAGGTSKSVVWFTTNGGSVTTNGKHLGPALRYAQNLMYSVVLLTPNKPTSKHEMEAFLTFEDFVDQALRNSAITQKAATLARWLFYSSWLVPARKPVVAALAAVFRHELTKREFSKTLEQIEAKAKRSVEHKRAIEAMEGWKRQLEDRIAAAEAYWEPIDEPDPELRAIVERERQSSEWYARRAWEAAYAVWRKEGPLTAEWIRTESTHVKHLTKKEIDKYVKILVPLSEKANNVAGRLVRHLVATGIPRGGSGHDEVFDTFRDRMMFVELDDSNTPAEIGQKPYVGEAPDLTGYKFATYNGVILKFAEVQDQGRDAEGHWVQFLAADSDGNPSQGYYFPATGNARLVSAPAGADRNLRVIVIPFTRKDRFQILGEDEFGPSQLPAPPVKRTKEVRRAREELQRRLQGLRVCVSKEGAVRLFRTANEWHLFDSRNATTGQIVELPEGVCGSVIETRVDVGTDAGDIFVAVKLDQPFIDPLGRSANFTLLGAFLDMDFYEDGKAFAQHLSPMLPPGNRANLRLRKKKREEKGRPRASLIELDGLRAFTRRPLWEF